MEGRVDRNLQHLEIELPQPAGAVGNYAPFVVSGQFVHVSGQLPVWNGALRHVGKLGDALGINDGYSAARLCALNVLAQLRMACDENLDRVKRVVRLGGFVNATPGFNDAPKCINGASDLMVLVFGKDVGAHARVAVGVASLPAGAAVEVDGVFEIA